MTKIAAYKANMIAKRAAAAGMSVADFLAFSEAENDRQRDLYELTTCRARQWSVLTTFAAKSGRSFLQETR